MKKISSIIMACLMLVTSLYAVSCGRKPTDPDPAYGKKCLLVSSQTDVLDGLMNGNADIAIIDSIMANYYTKHIDAFKDYQVLENIILAEEQCGIAARKSSKALIGKINEALIAMADSRYLMTGQIYGLASELLVKPNTVNPYANATDSSWDDIVAAKKVVIGYTLFAPSVFNEDLGVGTWMRGFDLDLARYVFDHLNKTYDVQISVEFVEIEWSQKEALLENGTIDLVWNGMSITPERSASMCISIPYLANKQVAVIKKSDAEKYASADLAAFTEKAKKATVIVAKGSTAEDLVNPVK